MTVKEKIQAELDSITRDLSETRADFSDENCDLMNTILDLHQIQNRLREVVTNLGAISTAALEQALTKEVPGDAQ